MDRRIRRTHQLLGNALVSLIVEKGYDAVTIKDITERADVAYVTFFRHFKEKDDLLFEQLDEAIHELEEAFHGNHLNIHQLKCTSQEEGEGIFELVQANSRLYHILLSEGGALGVVKRVRDEIAQKAHEIFSVLQVDYCGVVPPQLVAQNMAASLLNLIEWWLITDKMQTPLKQMGEMYHQLVIMPYSACILDGLDESISRDTP